MCSAFRLFLLAWIVVPSLALSQSAIPELEAIHQRLTAELKKQSERETAANLPPRTAYLKELTRIRDSATGKNDLELALEADAAIKAVAANEQPPTPKKANSPLANAGATYERSSAEALRLVKPQRAKIIADFGREFLALQQKLTRAGDLEGAKKAQDARKGVEGAPLREMLLGTRWTWWDTGDFTGETNWIEFKDGGKLTTKWGQAWTYECLSPESLKLSSQDGRNYFFKIDAEKKEGRPDKSMKGAAFKSIRYKDKIQGA